MAYYLDSLKEYYNFQYYEPLNLTFTASNGSTYSVALEWDRNKADYPARTEHRFFLYAFVNPEHEDFKKLVSETNSLATAYNQLPYSSQARLVRYIDDGTVTTGWYYTANIKHIEIATVRNPLKDSDTLDMTTPAMVADESSLSTNTYSLYEFTYSLTDTRYSADSLAMYINVNRRGYSVLEYDKLSSNSSTVYNLTATIMAE